MGYIIKNSDMQCMFFSVSMGCSLTVTTKLIVIISRSPGGNVVSIAAVFLRLLEVTPAPLNDKIAPGIDGRN